MKLTKRTVLIIAAVVAVVAVAVAAVLLLWKPEPKGIVVGVSTLPDSLNPVLEQNTSGLNADELVFDGLVNFEVDAQSGKLYSEMALAESIDQDPRTKKAYRVALKQVSWHDGTTLTAEDVVYSFAAYCEPANRSPRRDYLMSFIESVKAIDERTVEIEFARPIPPFRAYPVLTFKIIPSTYRGQKMAANMRTGENERNFAIEPIGTGPFKLAGWEIGKWVNFTANPAYFKASPQAASLVIKKVIDPVIRMNELRQGRINLVLETSPLDRPLVERMPNVDINWYLPYAFYQVAINTKSPLFTNADARVALSMALDRAKLIPSITDSTEGVVLNSGPFPADIFSSNIPEYVNESMPDFTPRDVEQARRLAAAGGITGKTAILLYPDSLGDFGARMAQGLASQLAAIGLKVEARRTGDQVYRRLVFTEKKYELALVYSEGFDNLYSSLGQWYRSDGELNISGIGDSRLDDLFDQWDKAVVMADWVDLTLRLNREIAELAPAMYLCTLQKDVYSRGIREVAIATDNPFLSVEYWYQ
ncbi:MAG: ABC transporter substrate-binding protein [Spirochaetes bacterium]|nr:ABC transporter substrate-binding protein [Spirochaetota bacterium]